MSEGSAYPSELGMQRGSVMQWGLRLALSGGCMYLPRCLCGHVGGPGAAPRAVGECPGLTQTSGDSPLSEGPAAPHHQVLTLPDGGCVGEPGVSRVGG